MARRARGPSLGTCIATEWLDATRAASRMSISISRAASPYSFVANSSQASEALTASGCLLTPAVRRRRSSRDLRPSPIPTACLLKPGSPGRDMARLQ
jgi:hypothetical protein